MPPATLPSSLTPNASSAHVYKDLRRARGMTMAALAARTGLSSVRWARSSPGPSSPRSRPFRRIAAALDEPVFQFFVEPVGEPRVLVRAAQRRLVIIPGAAAHYQLMTPNFRGDLEVMEMRIEPGGVSADVPLGHRGEECLVVLAGKARVQIGETTYDLSRGDAVDVSGRTPSHDKSRDQDTGDALRYDPALVLSSLRIWWSSRALLRLGIARFASVR